MKKPNDILKTTDVFIDCVDWDHENRALIVHRRSHGGREFVRVRIWNRHQTSRYWYPSRKAFVVPVSQVESLIKALGAAADGKTRGDKPYWFAAREALDEERYENLLDLNAPECILEKARKRAKFAR